MIEIENTKEGKTIITLDSNEHIEKIFNRYGFSFKKMKKIKYNGSLELNKLFESNTALMFLDKILNGGEKLENWLKNSQIEGFKNETDNEKTNVEHDTDTK